MKITYIERSPGTWRLRIETGRDAQRRRLFSYETVHGNEEAAARRRFEILNANEQGNWAQPDKLTLAGMLARPADDPRGFGRWTAQRLAIGQITLKTAENYQRIFDAYVLPALGGKRLQEIAGADVQALYTRLMTAPPARKLSASTVLHVHRILVGFFGSCRRARLIGLNPMETVEAPKRARRDGPPRALDDAGIERMLDVIAGHELLAPLTIVALATGMRRGELCGLRWRDVDLSGGRINVAGQIVSHEDRSLEWRAPKSRAGTRRVSIGADVCDMLRARRRAAAEAGLRTGRGGAALDDAYVFPRSENGDPINPDYLTRWFQRVCRRHGLPIGFHGLRHTHITALLRRVGREGAKAVSQRVGHSDISTTLSVYQSVFEDDERELADLGSGLVRSRVQNVPRNK
jgi:integrase